MPDDTKQAYVLDADGTAWVYRLVCSHLQRRRHTSTVWMEVSGGDFVRMTPAELRHVADVLDAGRAPLRVEDR